MKHKIQAHDYQPNSLDLAVADFLFPFLKVKIPMKGRFVSLDFGNPEGVMKELRAIPLDYIPLLGLSIPIEFALSVSSKTIPWASYKSRVMV